MSRKLAPRKTKAPDSEVLPDQYLFINKSANSASLSSSAAGERFYIHSHVHSKHHKNKRQQLNRVSTPDSDSAAVGPSSSKIFTWQSTSLENPTVTATLGEDAGSDPFDSSPWDNLSLREASNPATPKKSLSPPTSASPYQVVGGNAATLPATTPVQTDQKDQELLASVFAAFIERTAKRENQESQSEPVSPNYIRYKNATIDGFQECLMDPLIMYTTLTYCASCWYWAIGDESDLRPPEHYTVKAIEALRPRLQSIDQVDPYLIQTIYALAMSEMWRANYQPATTHLKMIRYLVFKAGGFHMLKPHMMEGLILCDKYTALGNFSAPIFHYDWEPEKLPARQLGEILNQVRPILPNLGRGFFEDIDEDQDILGPEIRAIINDLVQCMMVAVYARIRVNVDANIRRYLFMQHQSLVGRLLALSPPTNQVQECVRVALIIWLLKGTKYFGAQLWAQWLLPRLRDELSTPKSKGLGKDFDLPVPLVFWMCHLGAITADDPKMKVWFLRQTMQMVGRLRIRVTRESFRAVLDRYLFLESEGISRFESVLRSLGMTEEG